MKDFQKSDYAINKKVEDAIVYKYADGTIKKITVDDFGGDIETFRKWKELSDIEYAESEKKMRRSIDREIPIEALSETDSLCISSYEDVLMDAENEKVIVSQMSKLVSSLTEIEKRRFYLYVFVSSDVDKIAQIESVTPQAIYISLTNVKKKFEKALKYPLKNGTFFALSERLRCYESYFKKATEDLKNRKKKK